MYTGKRQSLGINALVRGKVLLAKVEQKDFYFTDGSLYDGGSLISGFSIRNLNTSDREKENMHDKILEIYMFTQDTRSLPLIGRGSFVVLL